MKPVVFKALLEVLLGLTVLLSLSSNVEVFREAGFGNWLQKLTTTGTKGKWKRAPRNNILVMGKLALA